MSWKCCGMFFRLRFARNGTGPSLSGRHTYGVCFSTERDLRHTPFFFLCGEGRPDVFSSVGMSAFLRSAFGSRGLPRCPVRRAARIIAFLSFLNFVSRVLDPLQTRAHMIVCCRMTGSSGTVLSASGGGFDVRRLRRSLWPYCRDLRAGRFAGSGS